MAKKKSVANYAMWTIMALLVLGLMGIGTRQFTAGPQSVGSVGKREISAQRYSQALNSALQDYSQQLGTQLTLQQAQLFGVPQQALSGLVATAALDNEGDQIGISVGDARVAREVQKVPGFQGANGNFDPAVYRSTLQRVGLNVTEFERQVRDEIARTILQTAVSAGLDAPKPVLDAYLDFALTKRDVSILRITPEDLASPVATPTEADLRSYFEDHGDEFTVPETRSITYVSLTPDQLAGIIEIEEAALRKAYDSQPERFNQPERRLVERLVFLEKAAAEAAQDKLASGEITFEELVAERGLDLADTDLGDVTKSALGAAGDAVFGVAGVGQTVLATTSLGPAIFRVNAILAAKTTDFEAVRSDLAREEALKTAKDRIADLATQADDLLAGGATLEEVAAETDAELATIAWTPASADGIAADANFSAAAAAVAEGDFPQIKDLANGGVFALRLDSLAAERPQTFDEAKPGLMATVTAERTAEALHAQGEIDAGEIRGGSAMSVLKGSFSTQAGLTRTSVGEGLTPDGLRTVFEMAEGEIRVVGDLQAAYVIRLDATHAPDLTDATVTQNLDALAGDLRNSYGQDIFELYTKSLTAEAGVSINQAMINAVHANFP